MHVADADQARQFAAAWPERAQRLVDAFWPGPLTVIVPRRTGVAGAAAGGQDTIALRCPSHPVARALLAEAAALGVPGVAAPSANRFGRISPTTAAHVVGEFGVDVLVLDGGLVRWASSRPSSTAAGAVRCCCARRADARTHRGGPGRAPGGADAQAPRASGTLAAHYAPRAAVRLMEATALDAALRTLPLPVPGAVPVVAVYSRTVAPKDARLPFRCQPADAEAAAQDLFAALRMLDASGAPLIWIETPPADPAWEGVRDRLQRAAAAA